MGIENCDTIPKSASKYANCNLTTKWEETDKVILLTTKNGGASTTDEIPGDGIVKQRIADQEKLIQSNKLQSINKTSNSASIIPSSSEISISSQQFYEENHNVQQKPKKSRIPIRNNSNVSLSSNNSSLSHLDLFQSSKISVAKGSSLFQREARKDNTDNWYKINKAENWILISPELLDLVKDKKLIKDTDSKKADALTYRETDKVRLMNLSKNEISILEEKLPELCKKLKSNQRINVFRS